ncbi:MAG: transposase [Burkholderiales bacterium]|nr:MAG: transposase [Burkholderiales bacterium]
MARRPRQAVTAIPHHVLLRGHNRQPVFVDDADRRQYLTWLHEAGLAHGLSVHAYVLMDAQVQLLATPDRDDALSLAMQAVGRRYVRWFNQRHGRSGTLWEGRFRSSLVEADRWLLACQRHLESGPVRAGRVGGPADWPWSSHRHHVGLAVDPMIRPHPALWTLGNTPFERESAYRRLFDESVSQAEHDWIQDCLVSGKPTASADFQRRIETSHGLRLLPRPVGRPRRTPPAAP